MSGIVVSTQKKECPALTPEEKKRRKRLRRLAIMFPFLVLLAFVAWAFTTNVIPSESMLPTIKVGDHILTMRSWLAFPGGRMPARGDIILFDTPPEWKSPDDTSPPPDPASPGGKTLLDKWREHQLKEDILIKRVVGLPGETVQVKGNDVYINGTKLQEDYTIIPADLITSPDYKFAGSEPLKLKEDELFVLGDNRNNSDDGRFHGALSRSKVIGKFVRVLFNEGQDGPNTKSANQPNNQSTP